MKKIGGATSVMKQYIEHTILPFLDDPVKVILVN